MERLLGKLVQSDAIGQFVQDFLGWAGGNTANARVELDAAEMAVEIVCERNEEFPLIVADGLAGGGDAVGAWADAEGFSVVETTPDELTLEAKPAATPKVAQTISMFLSPAGRWRVVDVSARRTL